jgi:hypothetical protein
MGQYDPVRRIGEGDQGTRPAARKILAARRNKTLGNLIASWREAPPVWRNRLRDWSELERIAG